MAIHPSQIAASIAAGLLVTLTSCTPRSPTEMAEQTTSLCGVAQPFERVIENSFDVESVAEKPAAGADTTNVTFLVAHRIVNLPIEITVKVSDGEALSFSGRTLPRKTHPRIRESTEFSQDDKDALCAGELAPRLLAPVTGEVIEIIAGAAGHKLEVTSYWVQHGKLPASVDDVRNDRPPEHQAAGIRPTEPYSLRQGGGIVIDLPTYLFRHAESPQIYLTPQVKDTRLEWACTSNVTGPIAELLPAQCRSGNTMVGS